jgi:crotonyl-CoA reductase
VSELVNAVLAGADADELLAAPPPSHHRAAYLRRADVEMFGDSEPDVRRSLNVGEVPFPEPAPDEVVIAVMASAVNYNTVWSAMFRPVPTFRFLEQLGRQGGWAARHDLDYHVVGSDCAGVIVRLGVAVRRWQVGDRVTCSPSWIDDQDPATQADGMLGDDQRAWGFETNFGAFAQFTVAKANQCLPKAEHLTWEEAACNTLCMVTAYRMLVSERGARMKQGDIVLVWGAAGGLGSYGVQFVRNGGGIPVGVVGTEQKTAAARRLGCEIVLNRRDLDLDARPRRDAARTMRDAIRAEVGEDPHIVFEHVGRETFDLSVFCARKGGSIVTCASSTGYLHEYDNRYLWMRIKRIIGSHGANWQECWEANRLLCKGRVAPALSAVYALDDVGEAVRQVQTNSHIGKIGVLCIAPKEGLGVTDPELRARLGEAGVRPLHAL